MSTDEPSADGMEGEVRKFLQRNFPQIQLHGGDATIRKCDRETGTVDLLLTGACSGCGISPMTIQAIKRRLPSDIPEIDEVTVETGTVEEDDEGGESHHGMGGHPAGGGVNVDYDGEIPDWRKKG